MKKVVYIIIIMLSFISFGTIVNAAEYNSEMTPQSKSISDIEIDKIVLESFVITKYVKTGTNVGTRFELMARFKSGYDTDFTVNFKYALYDANKNLIKEYNQDVVVYKDYGASQSGVIYTNQEGFDIDIVKFYTISITVPEEARIFDGADTGSYFYENFNTEIDVRLNNIYNVKQSFNGRFKGAVRAVDVQIPYRHTYKRSDGTKINKRAVITDVKASDSYSHYVNEGKSVYTVGQAEPGILEKEFSFEYKYNVGRDKLKDNDEFVFYLVKDIPVEITDYAFKITMPEKFNKDNIYFVDGDGNIVDNIEYQVEDNVITGKFLDSIGADSEYAIKIILPNNYFVNTTLNISNVTWISFIIPIVFMVLTISLSFVSKRTKNNKHEHVGLYLDEAIDSLELGYILKGGLKETDISSLIFYLANKGYVNIEMEHGNYTINKVKDYDGKNKVQGILMKRLFSDSDSVTRKNLKERLKNIKEEIEKYYKYRKSKRFYIRPVLNYKLIFWLMIFAIYYLVMYDVLFEYQPNMLLINVITGFVGFIIMLVPLTSKKYQLIEKVLCMMVGVVLVVSPIILSTYQAFLQDNLYVAAYIIGVVCVISIGVTSSMMNRRTRYGNYLYRKISSYKSYLINVPVEEVKEMVDNNSNYFYDVLPYVLIMGMSDKFYEKFEHIELESPNWYKTNKFNLEDFYTEIKNIYSDFFIAINKRI